MTSYESERALVYLAEQIIKTFGKDFGFEIQEPKQEPVEPLIKDEKVRKAVRAWAEANGFNTDYYEFNIKTLPAGTRFSVGHYDIEFIGFFIYDLQTENSYTLAKLCGEEEE